MSIQTPATTARVADVGLRTFGKNAHGRLDVLGVGLPGTQGRWYENPGPEGLGSHWPEHSIHPTVGNESPLR